VVGETEALYLVGSEEVAVYTAVAMGKYRASCIVSSACAC
jgi:hypothetical protein